MIVEYIQEAMSKAQYEKIDDPLPYFGTIKGFKGVWAQAKTLKACETELQEVLEEWLVLKVRKQQFVPTSRKFNLNTLLSA